MLPFIKSFNHLHQTRNVGMAACGISYTEIESYCSIYNILDKSFFASVIRFMDKVYMSTLKDDV